MNPAVNEAMKASGIKAGPAYLVVAGVVAALWVSVQVTRIIEDIQGDTSSYTYWNLHDKLYSLVKQGWISERAHSNIMYALFQGDHHYYQDKHKTGT